MIDLLLLAIVALVAWCVASEGAYGAGVTLISVILSGLLAMNYFEPLANFLQTHISKSWKNSWDVVSLIGLFAIFVLLFRLLAEKLMPTYIQVNSLLHQIGSWGCGVLTGYVTMAFLLTALHTAPMPRDYWGFVPPERERRSGPLSLWGPDYQWLGFTQYVTEHPFVRSQRVFDSVTQSEVEMTRMFDGRTGWNWNIPDKQSQQIVGKQSHRMILPSFTIRYASRRERLAGSSPSTPASQGTAPAVKKPPPRQSGNQAPGF